PPERPQQGLVSYDTLDRFGVRALVLSLRPFPEFRRTRNREPSTRLEGATSEQGGCEPAPSVAQRFRQEKRLRRHLVQNRLPVTRCKQCFPEREQQVTACFRVIFPRKLQQVQR